MKLHYYPETDSLYIELNDQPGADAVEVSDGLVIDVDEQGNPVGIDIDRASLRLDLTAIETVALPAASAADA
jgi:uncharacterized protein YuzE